ncbi:hypothetical protein N7533_012324 [Penicillium manginii]|uniref:uncharacterized protein n=1 Tax=Penicillium manginii TaxID=203109 RepID=UPI0025476E16|nr:uncharacterized protein N7533_012324 [Penicillium manginii]KAJ5739540.1 hypothetical protein N7533_012324 [Penicillium manginii]
MAVPASAYERGMHNVMFRRLGRGVYNTERSSDSDIFGSSAIRPSAHALRSKAGLFQRYICQQMPNKGICSPDVHPAA